MTRRSHREWRIFLWVTVVAAIVSAGQRITFRGDGLARQLAVERA